ncbi:MAG: MotA/TolQ/ExbB proton channel family protein [Candidatus Competibacteraceae bacterium]|nr:MotA/TolQ/ExbB proton channel family protein [Candidatus Competibacteraceae bacterium]
MVVTLITLAGYLTFVHFYDDAAGREGWRRYLGNGYCQLMISVFLGATLYAALHALGLRVERYHLQLFSQTSAPPAPPLHTLIGFLSGRRDSDENGLLKALQRWRQNARSREDFANLSDYLLLLRGQQHQHNFAPLQFTIWALPLLGFIGTVVGITQAIGGLEQVVATVGAAPGNGGLTEVLAGLQFAFDTTFVGLILVIPTMLYTLILRASAQKLDMYYYEILLDRLFHNAPA